MRRRLPPLNAIAAFETAARVGGFTRAAEELAVAQPAITRHITNLEDWFGVKLFHRHGNRVTLTREGESLAEATTAALDRLEVAANRVRPGSHDEVLIGASFGMAHMWLMPRMSGRGSGPPRAVVNFLTSENYRDFDQRDVDFSIRFGMGQWPGKRADLLFPEAVQVIAAPALLRRRPDIDPAHLPQTLPPELLLDHGDLHKIGWITWPHWFELVGYPVPDRVNLSPIRSFPSLLEMVKAGEGLAIGAHGLDDDAVAAGEIVRVGPVIARPGYGYFLVYDESLLKNPAPRAVRDLLVPDA
ncbi:MAG: LysR family transcriptional regulator [Pseudomonadota bacterium]